MTVPSPPTVSFPLAAESTTEDLLTRAGAGDRYAFSALYNRLMPTVLEETTEAVGRRVIA